MTHFREAQLQDIKGVLGLMAVYYKEEAYPFDPEAARAAVTSLLENNQYGALWVIGPQENITGYMAVTLGFSLEYRGRDAFIDELYIAEEARGQGLGAEAMRIAEEYCRANGVRALHLEVESHRKEALQLYTRWGFENHQRALMTKPLEEN